MVARIMRIEHSISSAMLAGQVATPRSVSGVTTAPSRMPMITEQNRASTSGSLTGLPSSAAPATATTEPDTSAAGSPK